MKGGGGGGHKVGMTQEGSGIKWRGDPRLQN